MKPDPNDPRLTAYALGELDGAERDAVEAQIKASPECSQAVEEVREIATLLADELKKEPAAALSQLDRIAIEAEAQKRHQRSSRFPWIGVAVAASVLVAVGAYFVMRDNPTDRFVQNTGVDDPAKNTDKQKPKKRTIAKKTTQPADSTDPDDSMKPDDSVESSATTIAESTTPDTATDTPDAAPAMDAAATLASEPSTRDNRTRFTQIDDVSWIDELVTALWKDNGIKPSAVASDGEFIRRAYLDIVGHVPPAAKAAAYIASRDKNKKSKLILDLVNSEDYTKHWAGIWSNLLIGRQPGRNIDGRALQKYLRDSFADNKPWNRLVYELVTAKGGSTTKSVEAGVAFNGATNFMLAHMNDGNVPATAFTTRLFLGVQVQCTQCHDHPFNDRTQEAFWGINAFFQKMQRQEHNDTDDTGRRRFLFSELRDADVDESSDLFVRFDKRTGLVAVTPPRLLDGRRVEKASDELNLREILGRYITDTKNDLFTQAIANRMWGHFVGRGIVHPLDDMGEHNPASNPELVTKLAENFRESNYDLKRLITWIAMSLPYSLSSETNSTNKDDDQYFSHYPLKQMSPDQFFDSLIVASQANEVGSKGWEAAEKMKKDLQDQFTTVFGNDENMEADTFTGTIPQALLMMNGSIMAKAVSKEKGSFLHERVDEISQQIATKKVKSLDQAYAALLNDLYLAAVSRYPNQKEKSLALLVLNDTAAKSKDRNLIDAYQDIFWALLNSSEFVLNH